MKKMKRLKHRLLEQIKSSAGVPPKASDRAFEVEREQFELVEASLIRLQAASAAWAGALDTFGASTQTLSEEMARHTILLATPSSTEQYRKQAARRCSNESNQKGKQNSDPVKVCRALQEIMTSVDKVFQGVHDVFLEAELRPLIHTMSTDVREVHTLLDDRAQKLNQFRALSKSSNSSTITNVGGGSNGGGGVRSVINSTGVSNDENGGACDSNSNPLLVQAGNVCNSTGPKTKSARLEFAERSLQDSTEKCLFQMSNFEKKQMKMMPDNLGALLGCYYSLATRVAADMHDLVPAFPQAACAMVDIAANSDNVRKNNERRQRDRAETDAMRKQNEEAFKKIRKHISVNTHLGTGASGAYSSGKSTSSGLRSGKWRSVSLSINTHHVSPKSHEGIMRRTVAAAAEKTSSFKKISSQRPKAPSFSDVVDQQVLPGGTRHLQPLSPVSSNRKSIAKRFSTSFSNSFRVKPGANAKVTKSGAIADPHPKYVQPNAFIAEPTVTTEAAAATCTAATALNISSTEVNGTEEQDDEKEFCDSTSEGGLSATPVGYDENYFSADEMGLSPPLHLLDTYRMQVNAEGSQTLPDFGDEGEEGEDTAHSSWSSRASGRASAIYALEYGSGKSSNCRWTEEEEGNLAKKAGALDYAQDDNGKPLPRNAFATSAISTAQMDSTTAANASRTNSEATHPPFYFPGLTYQPPPPPPPKTIMPFSKTRAASMDVIRAPGSPLSRSTGAQYFMPSQFKNISNNTTAASSPMNSSATSIGFATMHEQFRV